MMMEWYGNDVGDLVVPKDQEYFDRLPSPDSWSQWGTCGYGNSGWPNNFDAGKITILPDEKSQQRMLFGTSNREINQSEEVELSNASSNIGGSSDNSFPRNSAACGRADYCFNNLTGTDATDDIFLSSLLQDDDLTAAHSQGPLTLPSQSRYSMMSSGGNPTNRMLDFQGVSCDTKGFTPSDASGNGQVSISDLGYGSNSDQRSGPSVKTSETREILSSNQDTSMISEDEDSSIEELVLMGLEAVVSKLSNKTRVCVRDSLYRLAEHSKKQICVDTGTGELPLDKFPLLEIVDGNSRLGRTEAAESKTNTIDRAVANLVFSNVDANVQDIFLSMEAKFGHEGRNFAATGGCSSDSSQADTFVPSRPSDLLAQSEVPVFSQQDFFPTQDEAEQSQCVAKSLFLSS